MSEDTKTAEIAEIADLTATVVVNYVQKNNIPASELPALIQTIAGTFRSIVTGAETPPAKELVPAVPIRKSVQPDHIVCLEDGRKFKSLKRHLRTKFDLSPEEYRAKWGLPKQYPMVAPSYAAARSELAKNIGLGQGGRKPAGKAPVKAAAKSKGRAAK